MAPLVYEKLCRHQSLKYYCVFVIFLVLLSDIVLDSSQSFFLDRMRLKMETPIKLHRRGVTRKSVGCGERCVGSGVLMVRARACREDGGSFPPPPFRSLGNFVHPTLPVSFGRDTKSRWSKLLR